MINAKKTKIGALLLQKKLITQEQLDRAIMEQSITGKKIGQVLVDLKYLDESQLLEILSDQMNIPLIDLKNYEINKETLYLLPESDARRLNSIVLNRDDQGGLLVGMVDPLNLLAHDELERILKQPIHIALVSQSDIKMVININYRHDSQISSLSQELATEMGKYDYDSSKLASSLGYADAPVVKLLQSIFDDAAQVDASDVHIEPDESVLRLRLRIDGVLHEQIVRQANVADALSLRLKLMAGLNIAEKRLPQDGRFSIKIKSRNYDVRLSTMPGQYGESVVMRLLNQSSELLRLDQMGIPKDFLAKLRKIIALPYGLLLITGPTGSGKSTTLYGMLSELNTPNVKIITVEDPVEYRLARITQVQVQPAIKLDFARILRAVLRQDPDIVMIGELRDKETAEIALRAAMTGHFVFATLHTNNAASSPERLINMGAESYLLATVLRAVIAQRLVRKICKHCIEDYIPSAQEKLWLESLNEEKYMEIEFKRGKGCTFCYNTGYKGQIGIYELLEINEKLGALLKRGDMDGFLSAINEDKNYQTLISSGLRFAKQGVTTLEEVMYFTEEILPEIENIDSAKMVSTPVGKVT